MYAMSGKKYVHSLSYTDYNQKLLRTTTQHFWMQGNCWLLQILIVNPASACKQLLQEGILWFWWNLGRLLVLWPRCVNIKIPPLPPSPDIPGSYKI